MQQKIEIEIVTVRRRRTSLGRVSLAAAPARLRGFLNSQAIAH